LIDSLTNKNLVMIHL